VGPLVLVGPAPPLRGGIAHFGEGLARALAERHEVRRVSFSRQYPGLLFPGRTQTEPGERPRLPASALLDALAPWTWRRAARAAAAWHPRGAVLMHWSPFFAPAYGGFASSLRRAANARVVLLCHNLHPHEPGPLDRGLSRRLLARVDGAVTLSESVAEEVRAIAPRLPLRRVAHPIVDVFPPPPSREEARAALGLGDELALLFFGFVRPYKGLDVLLQALPQIRSRHRLRLLVAGEFYEARERYDRLLDRLGIADQVTFLDRYVAVEEVPGLFAAADLCVQPYRSASQSGVSKLAMQFGCPVVLTDVGGLAEDVADGITGYVVPPEDPAAIAAAVDRFCRDRERHDFGAAIREARARFGWGPLVSALEELLA
jgi:D-inositol-3-phosphate glycosyltransferase